MHSGRAYAACVKILQVKGVVGDSVPGPKLQCTGQGQPGGCHVSDAAICLQSQVRATLAQAKYRSFMQTLIAGAVGFPMHDKRQMRLRVRCVLMGRDPNAWATGGI